MEEIGQCSELECPRDSNLGRNGRDQGQQEPNATIPSVPVIFRPEQTKRKQFYDIRYKLSYFVIVVGLFGVVCLLV